MLKNLINTFNWISITVWAGVLGVLSFGFFLGTREDKMKLVEEPILTFLGRFAIAGLFGVAGIGLLVLINYIFNKTVLTNKKKVNIKGLAVKSMAVKSMAIVLGACLIGALAFVLF